MGNALILVYGFFCYALFLVSILYLIGFTGGLIVPKAINTGAPNAVALSVAVDISLIAFFGVAHSAMARPSFKEKLTKIIPVAAERSTFVLVASLQLLLLYALWQPLPFVIWKVDAPVVEWTIRAISLIGWILVFWSTFLIDHFDLFGLRQVWLNFRGVPYTHHPFTARGLYKFVRHPLMLGFLIAFWATPQLTAGHLLFAAFMTLYIFIGVHFEERDLRRQLGDDYAQYRERTAMIVPFLGAGK